jgi:hypothetical protein
MGLFSGLAKGAVQGVLGTVGDTVKGIMQTISDAKEKKIEANVALAKLEQMVPQMQMQINLAEAQNPSVFVSGWRPAVGWICSIGLAYTFLVQPLVNGMFVAFHWGAVGPMPGLDISTLLTLLLGMLGLAGYRTGEKVNGVARS